MDKINRLFETIKAIRKFNSYCKEILPDTEHLGYYTLKNLSDLIEKMEWLSDIDPDLLFLELTCSISSHTAYENASYALYTEIEKYIEWYNANRESVTKLTDYYEVSRAVDTILPYTESGRALNKAKEAMRKANEDKHIHHMLARAYGSIAGHGSQYEELSKADKELIDEELKDYKKHFKVNKVDLPQMYEDFHSTSYEEYLKIRKHLSDAYNRNDEEKEQIVNQIRLDMHQYVASILWPFMDYLQTSSTRDPETKGTNKTRNAPGRRPLGIFDSFEDMFNNHDHFIIIDNYIRTKGSLNAGEARSIFSIINRPEYSILKDRVSLGHFGTLIKKQYGLICSFSIGKSVADGKIFDDIESTTKALLGITETTQTK